MAIFGPKSAFLVILGQILPFFCTFCPIPHQKTIRTRCLGGFSVMWVTKLLISPVKKKDFLPKNDQKCQFWAKFGRFWAKNPFFYWRNQKFCYPHDGKPTQAPCSHCFLVGHWTKCAKNGNIWPKMTKNADFGPNLAVFGPKILIFM